MIVQTFAGDIEVGVKIPYAKHTHVVVLDSNRERMFFTEVFKHPSSKTRMFGGKDNIKDHECRDKKMFDFGRFIGVRCAICVYEIKTRYINTVLERTSKGRKIILEEKVSQKNTKRGVNMDTMNLIASLFKKKYSGYELSKSNCQLYAKTVMTVLCGLDSRNFELQTERVMGKFL